MASVLSQLSDGLAEVVEKAGPGVVRIEGRRRGPSSGISYAEGVVVTANHVLEWDDEIAVGLPDGTSVTASVAGRDPGTDLAALRLDAKGLVPANWIEPSGLKAGHIVLGVSRPGKRVRASLGIVTVRGDAWRTPAGGRLDHDVRMDIGLHAGFSGSLLVDVAGRALGLNTTGLQRGTPTLVPSETIRRVVDALLTHGHVRRGFLGVGTQGVRLPAELGQAAGQETGLLIVSVQPESAASAAGLMLGDVLVRFDGHALRHPGELLPLLDEERIGKEAAVKLIRAGELKEVRVTVGARSASPRDGGARP